MSEVIRGLLCLIAAFLACDLSASMAHRSFAPVLSPKQANLELEKLRSQKLGNYSLIFDLEHRTKKSKKIIETCAMFGSEMAGSRAIRIDLPKQKTSLLLGSVNSPWPSMWLCHHNLMQRTSIFYVYRPVMVFRKSFWVLELMQYRLSFMKSNREIKPIEKSSGDIYKPVVPEVIFTPADIGFSFVFWDKCTYLGPRKVLGLKTQQFKLEPGPFQSFGLGDVSYIRISLCTSYGTIIRVEYFNEQNVLLKKMDLLRFKKINGNWIMSEIAMVNELTGDRTTLRVKKVAFGCDVDGYLSEASLAEEVNKTAVKYTNI